jgi:hypothetical protein
MKRGRSYVFALVAAGAALVACAGDGSQLRAPTEAPATSAASEFSPVSEVPMAMARPSGLLDGLLNGLLGKSQPLPLFVCRNNGGPYADTAVVGLLGGTLHFGPHTLVIPPAAVLRPTKITATAYAGDTLAVTFQPQGLQFILPATLSLDYKHCAVQPTNQLQIDFINDLLTEILSIIPSLDQGHGSVRGFVSHFSVYAGSETRQRR